MFWQKRTRVFWTQHEMYAQSFHTLARGLWLTLGGVVATLIALAIFGLPLLMAFNGLDVKPNGRQIIVTATVFLTIAVLLNLWGKYTCFELQQPNELGQHLPGHRYLQVAFWCEMLSFVLKTSARALGVVQLKFLNLPLMIISQIAFLLFLRKMADVIERPDLKRRIDYIGMMVAGWLLTFGLAAVARRADLGPRLALVGLAVSMVLLVAALLAYVFLLARMALAAGTFARYLTQADEPEEDYVDDAAAMEG